MELIIGLIILGALGAVAYAFMHGKLTAIGNLLNIHHAETSTAAQPAAPAPVVINNHVNSTPPPPVAAVPIQVPAKPPVEPSIAAQLTARGLPLWTATASDIAAFDALPANQQAFLKFHAKTWNDTGAYTLGNAIGTTQQIYAANPAGTPGLV